MQGIYKIVSIQDPTNITRRDGTTCIKQTFVLREVAGKFSDQFVVAWFSDTPCALMEGSTVAATLRFTTNSYDGQLYQDIVLQEYVLLGGSIGLPKIPY